jgi:hypothetical protein
VAARWKNMHDLFFFVILRIVFRPVLEDNQSKSEQNFNLKNYRRISTVVPLSNSNTLDGWDICSGWMMQETPRK